MFSKQKGFASHNCLAFWKQREEKKHLQEKDRQTGQVCEALESRYTRWPPRCNMATTTNSEKILSLYNVQKFFLLTFLFSCLSIQTFFCEKKIKIKSQEKIRTKRFVWEGQHAPRRPETFIFYYSQHLLCTPVVHKSVWVSLEVNSTTVSDMLFVASVLSAYMLYPLCCITFFKVPDFHLQILNLYFGFL